MPISVLSEIANSCRIAFFVLRSTFAIVISVAGLLAYTAGTAKSATFDNESVDARFFGMHMHHLDVPYQNKGTTAWPFVKFGSWRIWNSYTAWYELQPAPGVWDFSRLDRYVAWAGRAKVDVLFTLGRTPPWASARPEEKCGATRGCAAEPKDISSWEQYVTTIANRYKGKVSAYEIWNEPAFSEVDPVMRPDGFAAQFYSGSAESMVKLAESAYKVLKAVDPGIIVVSPAVTSEGNGLRRLEAFLKAGGGKWCDVIGFHYYVDNPEASVRLSSQLRELLAKYRIADKPIWNTEMGFVFERVDLGITDQGRRARWTDVVDRETGAAYVARSHILMAGGGVKRLYWFNWDGEPPHPTMGISASLGAGQTPMTRAYDKVKGWLVGSKVDKCESQGSLWSCRITDGTGELSWALWSTGKAVVVDVRKLGQAKVMERLLGDIKEVIPDLSKVEIGAVPILLSRQ